MKKNIFVSHHHLDSSKIKPLIDLIEKKDQMEIRDSSISEKTDPNNAHNEEYIKSLIRPKIDWAGTVIFLIGEKTAMSEWVDWELEYAIRHEKRIIGVYLPGCTDEEIPTGLLDHADQMCTWRSDKINRALEGESVFDKISDNTFGAGITREECN